MQRVFVCFFVDFKLYVFELAHVNTKVSVLRAKGWVGGVYLLAYLAETRLGLETIELGSGNFCAFFV